MTIETLRDDLLKQAGKISGSIAEQKDLAEKSHLVGTLNGLLIAIDKINKHLSKGLKCACHNNGECLGC